jgi:FkbM family methyltransferase
MKPNITSRLLRNLKRLRMLFFGGLSPRGALEEMRAMRVSYSQFGEDLVVHNHFGCMGHTSGRFMDVGAFHPFKLSNTKLLSSFGWRGVNIDCDPEKIARFEKQRPHDHNVCAAVSNTAEELVWLHYAEGTTDRLAARGELNLVSAQGEQPLKSTPVQALTLTQILDASPFRGEHFHYLNIDCEGHDLAVLQGLDFRRYAPDLITIEALSETAQASLTSFLEPLGYRLTDSVRLTLFFKKCAAENSTGVRPA